MDQVFSPLIYSPSAKRVGHKLEGGKKRGSVTYVQAKKMRLVKIFIISLVCLTGSGTICIHEERLQLSEAG